jgi:hypothetical protein
MRNPRREVVRNGVGCPRCLAGIGEPCIGRGGQERTSNHQERTATYLTSTEPASPEVVGEDRLAALLAMPYGDYLLTPEWRGRRRDAIERAGGMCQLCCSAKRLHVHHRTYVRLGREHPSDLTVLCEECHDLFHEHRQLQTPGGTMSYARFVHAAIEERQYATVGHTITLGSPAWVEQAIKYASDNFPDYPEGIVVVLLREMRWPDRPVTVSEVNREIRRRVSPAERLAWLQSLDEPVEAPA